MIRLPAIALCLLLPLCTQATALTPNPTIYPPADRIIAIGDLHGDLDGTLQVFHRAGITDQQNHWIAGDLVVVQTGDQLDRGDDEQAILEYLQRLQKEASAAGGTLHILNGNHELMNARLDLRYVTEGGFTDFEDAVTIGEPDSLLLAHDKSQWARITAFRPGGPYARLLAERNCVIVIGETVFAHGGVLPGNLDYGLEQLNLDIRTWLLGEGPAPDGIHTSQSPTWTRLYSDAPDSLACATLDSVLTRLDVKRLVVGHTIQDGGITAHCSNQVWCIDVGIAEHYGGSPAALEIIGDQVRVLDLGTASSDP